MAVDFSNMLVVHPGVQARSLAEYLALARRAEGMDYGTSGVGSAGHLAGELLKSLSGARLNHVPFRGGGPAMNELVGFFFQAEDGIRDVAVTGVQTCALPICPTKIFGARSSRRRCDRSDRPRVVRRLQPPRQRESTPALADLPAAPGGGATRTAARSEERRVGKEGRCRGGGDERNT